MAQRKTVLITGCSEGGIGFALAQAFHEKGLRVLATARDAEKMKTLSSLCPEIELRVLDVTNEKQILALRDELARGDVLGGKLDILVNNAGVGHQFAALDHPLSEVRTLFETNLFGVMALVQALAPFLGAGLPPTHPKSNGVFNGSLEIPTNNSSEAVRWRDDGLIVMIDSVYGLIPSPFSSAYNASKAALKLYSETLRLELKPFGIRVLNVITGGVVSNVVRPTLPPPGSLYSSMKDDYARIKETMHVDKHTPTLDYARVVVAEALRPEPRYELWSGTYSWVVWFLHTLFGTRAFENRFLRDHGLAAFEKRLLADVPRKAKRD